ncbi:MAG: hypothetical protein MR697_03415 [Clostridiales bacterium]|nr:hypothetical protein [Clostridiales bacterium]
MPTNEELLKQLYKQQTQSQQNQQNPAAATSTDSAPASSAAAPAAGAAQGNTPQAPANGESTAPAADATGTGGTGLTGESSGKSLWDRYRESLSSLGDYKTPTANSQEELIRKMYESNLNSNKSQLESDYNQNLSDLGAEESKLGQIYYEQQRQAQAESDRNRQAFQEYANARGLNSGTGGQAELAQSNQLSANLNALRQSEAEKRAEVERQRQLLGQQYQKAIQKAQADNDLNLAKALYEEAVRVDESINSAAQADADRALQIFNMLNNTALSAAGAYAQKNNDLSLYQKLLAGDSTSELEDLYNKAQQIVSSGGYYSGGGGGGSSGTYKKATNEEFELAAWYIQLLRDVHGDYNKVADYLGVNNNYKANGIPYQRVSKQIDSIANNIKGYSDRVYTIGTAYGKDIADGLAPGSEYTNSRDGSVWKRSANNGKLYITKDGVTMEASYQEGYKG